MDRIRPDNKIVIFTPEYGHDWLVWKVYIRGYLAGAFKSMWEAEQFAKTLKFEYPGFPVEVM